MERSPRGSYQSGKKSVLVWVPAPVFLMGVKGKSWGITSKHIGGTPFFIPKLGWLGHREKKGSTLFPSSECPCLSGSWMESEREIRHAAREADDRPAVQRRSLWFGISDLRAAWLNERLRAPPGPTRSNRPGFRFFDGSRRGIHFEGSMQLESCCTGAGASMAACPFMAI